jgi:cation diffusion facilitator CzcD-associated flavoprotein CzcO
MGEGHDELKKFIIPTWSPGCRRISPGDGYLEALVQPNVEPVFSDITKVTDEGILTADGKLHKMDILVCATGFSVAFKPGFRVINGEGKTIDEDWTQGPKSVVLLVPKVDPLADLCYRISMYMGLAAPRFPNYFTIVGPGATWSNGTLLPAVCVSPTDYLRSNVSRPVAKILYRSKQLSNMPLK